MRLLQEGTCKLEELSSYGGEELQHLLEQCGIPFGPEDSRVSVGSSCGDWLWEQEGQPFFCTSDKARIIGPCAGHWVLEVKKPKK